MGKNKYEQVGFREMLQIPRKIWENLEDTRKMLVWDALGLGSRLKISREYVGRNLPWQSGFDSLCLCFGTERQMVAVGVLTYQVYSIPHGSDMLDPRRQNETKTTGINTGIDKIKSVKLIEPLNIDLQDLALATGLF